MWLFTVVAHTPERHAFPAFIRDIQDVRGVRIIRLQGSVGKEIGAQAHAAEEAAAHQPGVFARPVLFDFKATTECDFVTIAYLVKALRRRMAAHAQVGVINAPARLIAELEMAKVDGLFHVFASEEAALAELASPSANR